MPRALPFDDIRPAPILYADAFFTIGKRELRPSQPEAIPLSWSLQDAPHLPNGWGFVLFPADPAGVPLYAHGQIPPKFLANFSQRRAYIFVLEAIAQCLPLWALHPLIKGAFWSFVDNTAAQHALSRGYSKHDGTNTIVAAYWAAAARTTAAPWFERVTSKANISDAISRGDFTLAEASGWRRLHFSFDYTWGRLAAAVRNGSFDLGGVVTDIMCDLARQRAAMGFVE